MKNIVLKSAEGRAFHTDEKVIRFSGTIAAMLEACGMEDEEEIVIPLPTLSGETLEAVLSWIDYHDDHPTDPDQAESSHMMPWDATFLDVDYPKLTEYILAANYLDVDGLLDVACKKAAGMLKGKTTEEIREIFNLENDLTPEEEEKIRRENEWCLVK